MTEPPNHGHVEPTPEQQAANNYTFLPYENSFESITPDGAWANTVSVTTVSVYDPTERPEEDAEWVADHGERQLVRVDTNYKPTRASEHPVDLGRNEAAGLAAALLEAIEDTFHHGRVGELRAIEAAQLLSALAEVDHALANLRAHALDDLCRRIEVDRDHPRSPEQRGQLSILDDECGGWCET